tara:strand:+ start:1760 stop:1888 length:129 start_codon:yes stop_codon:yes gene_type:complete
MASDENKPTPKKQSSKKDSVLPPKDSAEYKAMVLKGLIKENK